MEGIFDDLLENEEMSWAQRSRALWHEHRDRNTNFFHHKTSQIRKRK